MSYDDHMTYRDDIASPGVLLGDEVATKPEGSGGHEEDEEVGEEQSSARGKAFLGSYQLCLLQFLIITVCRVVSMTQQVLTCD